MFLQVIIIIIINFFFFQISKNEIIPDCELITGYSNSVYSINHCYYLTDNSLNWFEIVRECEEDFSISTASRLTSISNDEERSIVAGLAAQSGDRVHIGLYDWNKFVMKEGTNNEYGEGEWTWIDGVDYSIYNDKWNPGEPSYSSLEYCVEIVYQNLWNDLDCSELRKGVCKVKLCNNNTQICDNRGDEWDNVKFTITNNMPYCNFSSGLCPSNRPKTCFGIDYMNISGGVCSNHGECVSYDECDCDELYYGKKCDVLSNDTCDDKKNYYNGYCYDPLESNMFWAEGEYQCNQKGGHLISVHDSDEFTHIQTIMTANGFGQVYLGSYDFDSEGNFVRYTDGTDFDYPEWFGGEPNNWDDNQHCLSTSTGNMRKLDDKECLSSTSIICKIKLCVSGEDCNIYNPWDYVNYMVEIPPYFSCDPIELCPDMLQYCYGYKYNDTSACSGKNGNCTNYDKCTCLEGYAGDTCNETTCYGILSYDTDVCHFSNGTCSSPNNCSCNLNYYGNECDQWYCYEINKDNTSSVCSGFGSCVKPNTCACDASDGYYGNECDHWDCYNIAMNNVSSVCSNHGNCLKPNNCSCELNYFGYECQFWKCYGINSTNSSACTDGAGNCTGHNVCQCTVGLFGDECENQYPFAYYPVAIIEYKERISICEDIILNGINSVGYSLTYNWFSNDSRVIFQGDLSYQRITNINSSGVMDFYVFVTDLWGRKSSIECFSIEVINSSIPNAYIFGPPQLQTYVNNKDFYLIGYFEEECIHGNSNVDDFIFSWEEINGVELNFTNIEMDKQVLRFKNGFPFVEKTYTLKFTIFYFGKNSSDVITLDIRKRGLIASSNDSSRFIVNSQPIGIKSMSYDPEERDEEEYFQWICLFNETINCSDILTVYNNNSKTIQFTPNNEGIYKITLLYQKDTRNDSITIEYRSVLLEEDYLPIVFITQIDNGYINPSEKLFIEGNIEPHEKSSMVTFEWESPDIGNLEDKILSYNLNSLSLVVKPNVITTGYVKFILKSFYNNITTQSMILLKVNLPPRFGIISVYPMSGYVLDDFYFTFSNWFDEDLPLTYQLEYIHCITNRRKLLKPYSVESGFRFQVSTQGCKKNNYSIELIAKIKDEMGVVSQQTTTINVYPTSPDNILDYLQYTIDYISGMNYQFETLSKIIKAYYLINPNCSELTYQEQLCMTRDECENSNIQLFSQEFSEFQQSVLDFVTDNLMQNQFFNEEFDLVLEIIDNYQLDKAFDEINDKMYDLIDCILKEKVDLISFDQFQILFDKASYFVNVLNESQVIILTKTIIESFINVMEVNELNFYLLENEIIGFDYEKDYSSNYIENMKFRNDEKVIASGDIYSK